MEKKYLQVADWSGATKTGERLPERDERRRGSNTHQRTRPRHVPQSFMGKVITYALGQWSGLEVYLQNGKVELDNNLCENSIRPLKIGAKNDLFFGSRREGKLACVAYTLIGNCKRHGFPLSNYLIAAMKALVEHGPTRAAELTPSVVARAKRLGKAA